MQCVYFVALLCLHLAGSEDLFWRPNTDWSNPSNWALGRVPCEGDVVDLSSAPRGSVINLDGSTTVRSVMLPVGSTLQLGRSISLRLSNSTTCEVPNVNPMVAEVKEDNTFIGARPQYWECSENWETSDGTTAKTAPCGKDRAFFREGHHYYSVESNISSVSVQYLQIRGKLVTTELISTVAPEFKLDLKVVPHCGEDPSLCPCLDSLECKSPTKPASPSLPPHPLPSPSPPGPTPGSSGKSSSNRSGSTAGIVVVVVILVLVLVAVAVLIVFLWLRRRHKNHNPYLRDDLIGEPEDSMRSPDTRSGGKDAALFDNPIYEMGVVGSDLKRPLGGGEDGGTSEGETTKAHEMEAIAILKPSGSEYEPVDYTAASEAPDWQPDTAGDDGGKLPALNEYERLS